MSIDFVEKHLETAYGEFIIRVYAGAPGKETVVLYTQNLNMNKPVLVRVHSECLTGDLFHSMKCDCGEQLIKSLNLIQKEGGVLIYLRQEGRGIGLFEKIKSYQLQEKGYDTFEANVLLGHKPDERSYEFAKQALTDLKIAKIKLLTNNPSKVSELAKLGIDVIERIPLIIPSNKINRKYFEAKRDKFKHFFHKEVSYYFYQFHVKSLTDLEEIGNFLKNKKKDPLLKICIGIAADSSVFTDKNKLNMIKQIFESCHFFEGFVPILHFTFKKSENPIADIKKIKKNMSFVEYLQTNDLPENSMPAIKLACKLFLADIPLDDNNFNLIENESFRKIIKSEKAFLLLDNSKGTGKQEPINSLKAKIDKLLNYGLNDIAIFGGFGPDDLKTYFELRRYYKINFSVDAESKLKTNGKIDMSKTKRYLTQLIRFDDPKEAEIEQTRSFLQQAKLIDWGKTTISGIEFLIHPSVFNPREFPSTKWYAEQVKKHIAKGKSFCEVGCGTGAISCLVAQDNKALNVTSSDLNPFAVENTRLNAKRHKLSSRLKVFQGDVFDSIPKNKKFDTIFWALPFGFLDPGEKIELSEMQVFDPGYRATRKFLLEAKNRLSPKGKLLIGFSNKLGNKELFDDLLSEAKLKTKVIEKINLNESEEVDFQLIRAKYY